MTEETFMLVMLAVVMLVGSYLAGSIPLVMRLSEEKLKTVTVLGAGLLVGTALTVIIPEGISSLYMKEPSEAVQHQQLPSTLPVSLKEASDALPTHIHTHHEDHARTIGLSLVLGFVFMMLVDQVSQKAENITATLGLVVHAAADGVALGAAATTSRHDVEMIVFLAIMLHKAPAAFGLVTFLLHERIDHKEIRKHLAIFSLSAPLLALITYFGIGQEQKETLNSVNATGIAMLFSAGTFLYVATVHVLPELTHQSSGSHSKSFSRKDNQHDYEYRALEESKSSSSDKLSVTVTRQKGLHLKELIIMIFGALLPLVITFGHSH